MKTVDVAEVDPQDFGAESERRGLSELLGTTDVAINHYRLAPGEGFPSGLHSHADQEEVFVVLEGEATFETLVPDRGAGEVTVGEGEAIRFTPGEFQSGRNDSGDELLALALGAPRDSEDVRIPVDCPECGRDDLRLDTDETRVAFVCPDCGAERVPADCPECGSADLRVTLGEGSQTVVVCRDCETEFETLPYRESFGQ